MLRLAVIALTAGALLVVAGPGGAVGVAPLGGDYEPPPPVSPPPPPPPASSPAPKGKSVLVATVGPAFTITLRTAAGKRVKTLKAGRYTIAVNDRSELHNFRLRGPGVRKATGVAYMGSQTWKVRFRKGKTYTFRCDPHLGSMKGSVRVR